MMPPKEYFKFNREQRIGVFLLIGIIVLIQIVYFFVDFSPRKNSSIEDEKWLAEQVRIDSLASLSKEDSYKIYPFNPNFITDYKGYKLGMSVDEIDRLLAFRKLGKFVNSAQEFQNVTKINDILLAKIAPYFKFPDWVKNKSKSNFLSNQDFQKQDKASKKIVIKDINSATKDDLMKIYGIGDAISDRILKQKEILGGFVNMSQMEDIWGLSPEVVSELNKYFKIISLPQVIKIDLNTESAKNLSKFPYFKYALAREIVTFRSMNNGINSLEDLQKIKGFPVEKIKIIALYLNLK